MKKNQMVMKSKILILLSLCLLSIAGHAQQNRAEYYIYYSASDSLNIRKITEDVIRDVKWRLERWNPYDYADTIVKDVYEKTSVFFVQKPNCEYKCCMYGGDTHGGTITRPFAVINPFKNIICRGGDIAGAGPGELCGLAVETQDFKEWRSISWNRKAPDVYTLTVYSDGNDGYKHIISQATYKWANLQF